MVKDPRKATREIANNEPRFSQSDINGTAENIITIDISLDGLVSREIPILIRAGQTRTPERVPAYIEKDENQVVGKSETGKAMINS